jgi:hypothetical protein
VAEAVAEAVKSARPTFLQVYSQRFGQNLIPTNSQASKPFPFFGEARRLVLSCSVDLDISTPMLRALTGRQWLVK